MIAVNLLQISQTKFINKSNLKKEGHNVPEQKKNCPKSNKKPNDYFFSIPKSKTDLFSKSSPEVLCNKILNSNLPKDISYDEYEEIRINAVHKVTNIIQGIVISGAVLFLGGMFALKSGKFDKQINKILSSDNKLIAHLREAINSKLRREIVDKLDFSSAKSHFHNIGTKKGKVSGAHEIKECIQTLINEKGNIYDIKQSKTQNGLWEILYEINGKPSDISKTVYISEPLTDKDAQDLILLCKNNITKHLFESINNILNEKSICDISKMETAVETALKEGFAIRTQSLKKATYEAKINIIYLTNELKDKTNKYNLAEQNIAQIKKELQELKKVVSTTSDEFQAKVSEIKRSDKILKELKSECDTLQSSLSTAKERYNHIKNSINIFGEKDGKLFAAYAHYDKNKIVVDSYFPIAHGSNLQKEFVDCCLNDNLLSLNNVKCLIGAKETQINKFFKQLINKFSTWSKSNHKKIFQRTYLGSLTCTKAIIALDIKKKKRCQKNTKI